MGFPAALRKTPLQEDAPGQLTEKIRKAARKRTKPRAMDASLEDIAKDYIRFPALTKEAPQGESTGRKSSFRNRHAAAPPTAIRHLRNHRQTAQFQQQFAKAVAFFQIHIDKLERHGLRPRATH